MADKPLMLRWEPFQGDAEMAMLGECSIGMIGSVNASSVPPGTWFFKIDGVDVKWIAKAFGHVKSRASARRAVNSAFAAWATRAGLANV